MKHNYDWKTKREKNAFLALEDGTVYRGVSCGADVDSQGEVVFNTGMAGYQEIISDPSYAGQFVTMTYPEIGSTGVNSADMESEKLFLNGFIIHEMNEASNWRSEKSLSELLREFGIPAISGIDTRALTSKLRSSGTMKGYMSCRAGAVAEEEAVAKAAAWEGLDGQDYAARVTCSEAYDWDPDAGRSTSWGFPEKAPEPEYRITACDFGIKWNILRSLRQSGFDVKVVPASTTSEEILSGKPDGVFFSNGPADPAAVSYAVAAAKELVGKAPIMGICLGHQILSLACGADTYRLKFGHHGCNHPVKNILEDKIEITSQNHNFAVAPDSIPDCLELTHINLNDNTVEGVRHRSEPMFAVQYHPEAGPGPHDPFYLFKQFRELIER